MPLYRRVSSFLILLSLFLICLASCSVQKQISRSANEDILTNKALTTAHIGISIYDLAANKYLYNYQGDKYFVPASNTKLPTCYAAMKYLGDSLVGLRYNDSLNDIIVIKPTSDTTFLHPDFKNQKVYDFLKNNKGTIDINLGGFYAQRFGSGWAWNDYQEYYMAERSIMPIYGNVVQIRGRLRNLSVQPRWFRWTISIDSACCGDSLYEEHYRRGLAENKFVIIGDRNKEYKFTTHFYANQLGIIEALLKDTLQNEKIKNIHSDHPMIGIFIRDFPKIIHSQPTDSLLKPMMHRSDNFFAEQSLLMVSNEMLGVMNDEKIIDTLLKTDFKDLPQQPRWADGSGLSRYNLFTQQGFVAILNKMKNEFGMERIKIILPTGGEGTISSYYKADSGYIYGKTGTLSGVVAFSGFLYTKKGKLLIFSTLVNNHQANPMDVRRAVEKFLQGIRSRY